jgi:hypothetical protein
MMVQILYNLEGTPKVSGGGGFSDVPAGAWFADAISWATTNEIVLGYGDGTFGPNDSITREQMTAILFRYAKYKGYDTSVGNDTNILSYDDAFDISEYAFPAMQWACGAGIIYGRTASTLAPKGTATRAEVAAIITRFIAIK